MMPYPEFYKEHIEGVINAYNDARAKVKNAASFVFLTDVHIHLNGRASVPLILEIGEKTDVNTVLCGGDLCWAWGSEAECRFDFDSALNYLSPIREKMNLYLARGNHDVTVRNSWQDDRGYTMAYEQVQKCFESNNSLANGAVEGKLYFYTDDVKSKTRFVILDTSEQHQSKDCGWGVITGMEAEQLSWLCNTALHFEEEGWSAVVMGHIPCVPELPGYSEELASLAQILEAFKHKKVCKYADFSNKSGELIGYLCGHNHKDRAAGCKDVLHISTGCDSYCKDDDLLRDIGTVNNTLFDLFLVDKDKRTVNVFRVGAGNNREFTY